MEKPSKKKLYLASEIPLWKKIIHISWPLLLLGLINTSYFFVDTLLASILVDQYNAISVLGIALPFIALGTSFAIIVVIGTSLSISKKLGENRLSEAEQVFSQGIILSFVYGSVLFLTFFFLAPVWMNGLNQGGILYPNQVNGGIWYIRISAFTLIPIIFRDVIVRTLRTEGRSLASILIPITALPINLLFDWIFMGPLNMGLAGAGLASLIGTLTGVIIGVIYGYFISKRSETRINFKIENYKISLVKIKEIFVYGTGPFLRRISNTLISIVGTIYVVHLLAAPGDSISYWSDFLAVSMRTIAIMTVTGAAFTQGTLIVLSYYYGKKDYETVKSGIRLCLVVVVVLNIIGAILLILLTKQLLNLFNFESDSVIYRNAFYILAASLPFVAMSSIYLTFYTAIKKLKYVLLSNFLVPLIIDISVISLFYFVVYKPTETSALFFIAYPITAIIQIFILTPIFYKQYQKL